MISTIFDYDYRHNVFVKVKHFIRMCTPMYTSRAKRPGMARAKKIPKNNHKIGCTNKCLYAILSLNSMCDFNPELAHETCTLPLSYLWAMDY